MFEDWQTRDMLAGAALLVSILALWATIVVVTSGGAPIIIVDCKSDE